MNNTDRQEIINRIMSDNQDEDYREFLEALTYDQLVELIEYVELINNGDLEEVEDYM